MAESKEAAAKRAEFAKIQSKVIKGWKAISSQYPLVMEDLFAYIDQQRELYRQYGEERSVNGAPIDDHTVSALLQNGRGMRIVKTYIQSRIDADVAQPKKTK